MSYQRFNCSGSTGLTGKFHRGQQQPQTCARHALVVRSNKFASCRPAASLSATVAVEAALFTSVVAALINSYRPCGWSDQRLVSVQQSAVHDRGVFARCPISKGTVLGCYPGVKRSTPHMVCKISRHPRAKAYAYGTDHGWYLDPSDREGNPVEGKLCGIADTTMAFVNEPPPGSGTNISLEDGAGRFDVLFVANRDIYASEELYVDYGKFYDRSDYHSS